MRGIFFNGLDVLYHHAKVREDRTMRAGCCDLENRVGGPSRSLEMSPSIEPMQLPNDVL